MDLENYQEEICEYCETFIIEGCSVSQMFICEGRFCEEAGQKYLDDNEIWQDIKEFESIYQISNFGRVKSLSRFVGCGRGRVRLVKERILKPGSGGRYLTVTLCKKGHKNLIVNIHQFVAIAFHDHKPDGHTIVVDHKDNLQLISHRENDSKDQFRHNRSSRYVGVYWDKYRSKWRAKIIIKGKAKYLGSFKCELEASRTYQNKLKEITED